jgi:hypothetical protein
MECAEEPDGLGVGDGVIERGTTGGFTADGRNENENR